MPIWHRIFIGASEYHRLSRWFRLSKRAVSKGPFENEKIPFIILDKRDFFRQKSFFADTTKKRGDFPAFLPVVGGFSHGLSPGPLFLEVTYTNHGDLDIGTFVFDCMGVRWAEELGPGNYAALGYFTGTVWGGRWKSYAKRPEGQNTLVINPGRSAEDQYPFARCAFSSFSETADGGTAVLDMIQAYRMCKAESVVRTFTLSDNRSVLTVSDNIVS